MIEVDGGGTVSEGQTVHLDTSLVIEQQKSEKLARPVRKAMERYKFRATSTYAKKEFKRAWLQDLALIYRLAQDCQRIEDLHERIEKSLWHTGAKRRRSRCIEAICSFLSRQPGTIPLNQVMPRLRVHLVEGIFSGFLAFDRCVSHLYDGTGCVRAREKPIRAANGSLDVRVRDCQVNSIKCTVHSFFSSNREFFLRIEGAIRAAGEGVSGELKNTAKTIRLAVADSRQLCDNKNCTAMSDALIAVDGMPMDHFAANNPREWTILAAALGKPLVNPVSRHDEH